jgi:pSer/pThr/pTyr-binding forkhead associated (FHA) protein
MHKYNSIEDNNKQITEYEEDSEKITIRIIAGDDQFPIRYVNLPSLIGRKDNATNVLPGQANLCFYSPFLSRKHAELVSLGGGSVALRDLGSSNGTFLNGVIVNPMKLVRLNDGDLIQFGTEDANQGIF